MNAGRLIGVQSAAALGQQATLMLAPSILKPNADSPAWKSQLRQDQPGAHLNDLKVRRAARHLHLVRLPQLRRAEQARSGLGQP